MAKNSAFDTMTNENIALFYGLEPQAVYRHFCHLSAIPRAPGNREAASRFVCEHAEKLGLAYHCDTHCNVVVQKPAHKTRKGAPSVLLQAHLDMVCEKDENSTHNFDTDPLQLCLNAGKVTAKGTTLGADNGVGVAYMMALMESENILHPALELVFTTDEESDMSGARELDYSTLHSRLVINLDSPPIGVCGAGELEVRMHMPVEKVPATENTGALLIEVQGLQGGHTGQNAMLERGNAIVLLNRILIALQKRLAFSLAHVQGGSGMSSAYARSAKAVVLVKPDAVPLVRDLVLEMEEQFKQELLLRDPLVSVCVKAYEAECGQVLQKKDVERLQRLLLLLPDGVFLQNKRFPGAMQICSNVGVLDLFADEVYLSILIRGMNESGKQYLYEKVLAACDSFDVRHEIDHDVPPWEENVDEAVLNTLKKVYTDCNWEVSQGTLECGFFCRNLPGSSVLSLGCPYYNAHSPSEYFLVEEAERYWKLLLQFLEQV